MALTYTPPGELGVKCPNFKLPSVDGKTLTLNDFSKQPILVVMFICNHCPYVMAVEDRILKLAREMQPKNVQFVAICSNDASEHPDDSLENLKNRWQTKNYPFPYLHDESQEVAKAFGAVCTPDFFVFDSNRQLAYRGRLDDSWKSESKVTRMELKDNLEMLLKGQKPQVQQYPSMGCSIKWKD